MCIVGDVRVHFVCLEIKRFYRSLWVCVVCSGIVEYVFLGPRSCMWIFGRGWGAMAPGISLYLVVLERLCVQVSIVCIWVVCWLYVCIQTCVICVNIVAD